MSDSIIKEKSLNIRACRICLASSIENMVLLEENNGWMHLFTYCFGLLVTEDDGPRLLCGDCADNVKNYAKFKELCLKSNELWKSVSESNLECYSEKVSSENQDESKNILDKFDTFDHELDNESIMLNDLDTLVPDSHIKVESDHDYEELIKPIINDEKDDDTKENIITELAKKHDFSTELSDNVIEDNKRARNSSQINKINIVKTNHMKCKKCDKIYAKRKCFLKHLRSCKSKKRKAKQHSSDLEVSKSLKVKVCTINNRGSDITEAEDNKPSDLNFCGLCKFSSTETVDLKNHLNKHWTSNDLQCTLCEFVGGDMAAQCSHRYNHCRSQKDKLMCHVCGCQRKSARCLEFHYRLEHLKKKGGHCFLCNLDFDSVRPWNRHDKRNHAVSNYVCDVCGKGFYYKHQIIDHMLVHYALNKFICDVCGKAFKKMRYLKLHITTVHTKSGPLKCTHCNRMFKSEHTLHTHTQLLARQKVYKCEVCSEMFPQLNLLKSHMIKHSDEKPYSCTICKARYKYKSHLTVHMRSHTGMMPFKCEHCPKSFATTTRLKIHLSVHTGVRAHKCLFCERTFHNKKLLVAHCALRHKAVDRNKM